jgi:PAS domain-containing protein
VSHLRDAIIGYVLTAIDTIVRAAEEALLKTGALQRAILNSANFSSIATDAHGVIQIFNVGAERMLGYAAADELTYCRKDSSRFPVVVSVTALRDAQDAIIGYLLIGTDNSARKQAEEVLLRSEMLASAGRMAASIAHEINNPLETIVNTLYIVRTLRRSICSRKRTSYP